MQHANQIRPASVNDAEAICPLLEQLGYRLPAKTLLEKLALATEDRLAVVAEVEGKVVGFMTLHLIDWFHRPDRAARLSAVVVDNRYRREGIGRALVEFAEAEARRRDCSTIELTSSLRRKADGTYDFYASLGYQSADQTTYFRKALR
jgi:N-acetylglutamate synthase-like GNAT family acetyltransferase